MNKENTHIESLISLYLSNEASHAEKQEIETWLKESEENKTYFNQIKFVFDQAILAKKTKPVDVDKAWTNLQQKIKQNHSLPKTKANIFQKSIWWQIAASVVIVVSVSLGVFQYVRNHSNENNQIAVVTSSDSTINYQLTDSSKVFLNKNSKIEFHKNKKQIQLTGEAFFEVKHKADKPFIVKAEATFIKDIGTSFNVEAYPESNIVEVYVESGEVLFYTDTQSGITINKGEIGIFDKATSAFYKKETNKTNSISYKTKIFDFQNSTLKDVVKTLNSVYPETIEINNKDLESISITVSFDNEDIQSIVNIIAETLGLNATKTEKGFKLDNKK